MVVKEYVEKVEEKVEEKQNPFDRNEWGPKLWDILHTFSYNYSDTPTYDEQLNARHFFTSICSLLPCDYCKNHCKDFVYSNPPIVDNRNSLIKWGLLFHNSVNIRLHKKTWLRDDLDKIYDNGNAYCK